MEETTFPPSPNWFLPKIIASREDGTIAYGSKNNIVILKVVSNNKFETILISNAHSQRITAVSLSLLSCDSTQNTVVSCSDDGYVKLWSIDSLSVLMCHKSHWGQKDDLGKVISLDWSLANPNFIISVADNNTVILWNVLSNVTEKFSFQKINATCISSCPYNEKIAAIGTKSGLILITNLTGTGEIFFKLRGHDNEIQSLTWCPVPYNVFRTDEIYEEFLLASACQDKDMFIWRIGSDGKCEVKIHIPTSPISKKDGDNFRSKIGNNFSYLALLWSEPYKIYLSSNFGELIYFDIPTYIVNNPLSDLNSGKKGYKQSNFFKLGHCFHSRGLFAVTGSPVQGEISLFEKMEIKNNLKFKILANKINVVESSTRNSTNNEEDRCSKWKIIIPEVLPMLWTAGQDRKLVGCKSNGGKLEIVFNIHTVNAFVYCAVVSPHDPNKLAVAVGDGVIRLWNLTEPSGEIQMYWQKIKDRVMSLAWHPIKDGILAYGTSEGRVGLMDTNSNKPPSVFKPNHPDCIYNLSWGPQFLTESKKETSKPEFCLYTVCHNNLSMYIPSKLSVDPLNLSKLIPFKCKKQTDVFWKPDYSLMAVGSEDGSITLIEPSEFKIVYVLQAYKKLIQSIAWHPSSTSIDLGLSPYCGYFTSGSPDSGNEIHIYNYTKDDNVVKVERVHVLKGHYGYIQSVAWCPHIGGRLVSSSADGSVQIWDVVTQTALKNLAPNGYGMPLFSVWSPIHPDIILSGFKNNVLYVWRISTQSKTVPQQLPKPKKIKKSVQKSLINEAVQETVEEDDKPKENEEITAIEMAQLKTTPKNLKEAKMFSKSWTGQSDEKLNICYSLLKGENVENNGLRYSLPFLNNDDSYEELIQSEEDKFKKSGNWNEFYELSLMSGNIKHVLEEKIKTGQLNDFLVSIAPTVSPRLWQEACISYSKSLVEKKMFRKAASYLIVCHKIHDAIQLLVDSNLYLEALCVVRSNLPKSDPLMFDIIRQYAQWLYKKGSLLEACECYIYLKEYIEVANICGKKSVPEYLSLAALAFKNSGSTDLENLEATNALLKCFEFGNLELAERICNDHANLRHLSLLNKMYHTICQLDTGDISINEDILTFVGKEFKSEDINFPSSLPSLYNKHNFYRSKKKMFVIVTQELAFACCLEDKDKILTHLIKALSTCYRCTQNLENEASPTYKLINWLSPNGFLSDGNWFTESSSQLLPKVKSLRAFLCASLVEHFSDEPTFDKVLAHLDVLNEVKNDLMDKDSYQYHKNLSEVQMCEKRLMVYQTKAIQNKLENKVNFKEVGVDNKELNSIENEDSTNINEKQCQKSCEDEIKTNSENFRITTENGISPEKELSNENVLDTLQNKVNHESISNFNDKEVEENIRSDMVKLSNLRSEIERFEAIRINSPNPVPVYCMLKRLLEGISDCENARLTLSDLELKWKSLL